MKKNLLTNPTLHYQSKVDTLYEQTIELELGKITDNGALWVNTGKFTGRSPENKFIVKDAITKDTVNWGGFNNPIDPQYFKPLKNKMLTYLEQQKEVWIRDAFACAEVTYQLPIRLYTELPWSALFANNMFIRPTEAQLVDFEPEWQIIHAPNFKANPIIDGTAAENFSIISFTEKTILIGGSAYTGEIKKGIFTVLNFILPNLKNILSMHCSANMGERGDVSLFFGLSGTGKTTLSADPKRKLIGDDEHGWSNHSIFNFEGGCYAKTINLSSENEPDIFNAIKFGALLENQILIEGTNKVDYDNASITENTRVSYPIDYIQNIVTPSVAVQPSNIFFLTCDAYGILPPISKLNATQAMYQFISGYTAKVAGTEAGVTEPKSTFSACFGAPFLPLHPGKYAEMLGKKMRTHDVKVWMINTGWTGGPYGIGHRMSLKYTRAMITAALEGKLDNVSYEAHPVFGMMMPTTCPDVPAEILNPRNTWNDKAAYDEKATDLANQFIKNFEKYASGVTEEILAAAPKPAPAHPFARHK